MIILANRLLVKDKPLNVAASDVALIPFNCKAL